MPVIFLLIKFCVMFRLPSMRRRILSAFYAMVLLALGQAAILPDVQLSRDLCATDNPVYPNAANATSSFLNATASAGCTTSIQNFDSQTASATISSAISFPLGSPFNGSVSVSVVNWTLISQTCEHVVARVVVVPSACFRQTRTRQQCYQTRTLTHWPRTCAALLNMHTQTRRQVE